MYDVIVIGGGLAGLIAFRNLAAELDVLLLEARPRILSSSNSCLDLASHIHNQILSQVILY